MTTFAKLDHETNEQFAARVDAHYAARNAERLAKLAAVPAEEMEIRRAAMFNLLAGNIAATSFPV